MLYVAIIVILILSAFQQKLIGNRFANLLSTNSFKEHFTNAKAVLFETLLIPCMVTMTAILKCAPVEGNNSNKLYVARMGEWECYTTSHVIAIILVTPVTCAVTYYAHSYEISKKKARWCVYHHGKFSCVAYYIFDNCSWDQFIL